MAFNVVASYVNPISKNKLTNNKSGCYLIDFRSNESFLIEEDGIIDFVKSCDSERQHFEKFYASDENKIITENSSDVSLLSLQKAWTTDPGFKRLFDSLGDLNQKKILLLGNGVSIKELYFLHLNAKCIYTDLSANAVRKVKNVLINSELKYMLDNIEFHAVDACALPFEDECFDIIYGSVFVHHISNLDSLFSEIHRCLKKGGICRFLDDAYSPVWQFLKSTVLRPLQIHTHRKHGISPADIIATNKGGFKFSEIEQIKNRFDFKNILFERDHFFEYLLHRGTLKLGGKRLLIVMPLFRFLDHILRITLFLKFNGIRLVWGFEKKDGK